MSVFDLEKMAAFISGAGFAVFVAVWLLVKHDKRLVELTKAINDFSLELRQCLLTCSVEGRAGMRGRDSKS